MMLPFVAYLPEAIHYHEFHGSGVIAVVVTGLVLGHKSAVIQSAQSRVSSSELGDDSVLLENTVFLLIGLQASRIVTELANSPLSDCLGLPGSAPPCWLR